MVAIFDKEEFKAYNELTKEMQKKILEKDMLDEKASVGNLNG